MQVELESLEPMVRSGPGTLRVHLGNRCEEKQVASIPWIRHQILLLLALRKPPRTVLSVSNLSSLWLWCRQPETWGFYTRRATFTSSASAHKLSPNPSDTWFALGVPSSTALVIFHSETMWNQNSWGCHLWSFTDRVPDIRIFTFDVDALRVEIHLTVALRMKPVHCLRPHDYYQLYQFSGQQMECQWQVRNASLQKS